MKNLAGPTCAILLPLTSTGQKDFSDIESILKIFHSTCIINAGNDVQIVIYVGIDVGDRLLDEMSNPAEDFLRGLGGACDIHTIRFPPSSPANICKIWSCLARCAYDADPNCQYFILLGDDVSIDCPDWFDEVVKVFSTIAGTQDVPFGFGCVALHDIGAPGFPTFPVVHRIHMDIFNGNVIPPVFINQDGDPFLYNLYKPFGGSHFARHVHLTNAVGGVQHTDQEYILPRYDRVHVPWKNLLDTNIARIEGYLELNGFRPSPKKVLIDVVVPSFRVNRELLEGILNIVVPANCVTKFIIVVDDPKAEATWLTTYQKDTVDKVNVLFNPVNLGAPESRNVGIKESAADWILLIDDDVKPDPNILVHYAEAIEKHGHDYDAFVGPTILPEDHRIYSTSVLLSGVSFFWTFALTSDEMPWGVTANLLVRNYAKIFEKPLLFDSRYIKTGGGEDIDYCLKLSKLTTKSRKTLKCVPAAVAHHPWWSNGRREYSHFFRWALGDSLLINHHPSHTFMTPPNVVESIALLLCMAIAQYGCGVDVSWSKLLRMSLAIFTFDTACEIYDVYSGDEKEKLRRLHDTCGRSYYKYAVILFEMNVIRICSEAGHLLGPLRHYELRMFRRFDWFCGSFPDYPGKCFRRDIFRFTSFVVLTAVLMN